MNREQKVALIVGFAVVLVVGVLVSDHLSGARQLEIAEATEGDLGRVEATPVATLPSPTQRAEPPRSLAAEPTSGAVVPLTGDGPAEPVRITLGGANQPTLSEALGQALPDAGDSAPRDEWRQAVQRLGTRLAEGLSEGVPEAAVVERTQPRATTPSTPAPVRHTVRKDESLFKIAKQYLGDGNRWREIAEANPGSVGRDGAVRAGVTLVIPGAQAPAEPRRAAPAPAEPIRYTVRKNDSLSEISQRFLGSAKRVGEIVEANRGTIDDPDDIRVGMVLKIPARS